MAEGRNFNDQKKKQEETLRAGISEISGTKKEEFNEATAPPEKILRSTIDWIQNNSGVLIAAGLGVATVGFVTLFLSNRGGLKSWYEEESSSTTLH
jgi:hypothetical protein